MVNLNLFQTLFLRNKAAATDTLNAAMAPAYCLSPRHKLAQLSMTGCLNQTFYADAETQLTDILDLCHEIEDDFIAKTAVYCREFGHRKDLPALLLAILAARRSPFFDAVFVRIIDNGTMLRNFAQIIRSNATGRRSFGSRPKALMQKWLQGANEYQLLQASIGNNPSLKDLLRMVHPHPREEWRQAFFGWVLGTSYDESALPPQTRALLAFRRGEAGAPLPDVPFQLLTSETLSTEEWIVVAERMGWQALRMNLNTLLRHGALHDSQVAQRVAEQLRNAGNIARARVYPYQVMVAHKMMAESMPKVIGRALEQALEIALNNVPVLPDNVAICPDVSGSMTAPVTGYRRCATSTVRCVDVAALITSALLRKQPKARVIPFEATVVDVTVSPCASVLENAQRLAAVYGGGTDCSAPLAQLVRDRRPVDMVILVSDNQSWLDAHSIGQESGLMRQWTAIKRRNPKAKLVCLDLQPYGSTQAIEREDILNIGGFNDTVFDLIEQFSSDRIHGDHWVETIAQVSLLKG